MSAPPRGTASQYSRGVTALQTAYSRLVSGIAASPKAVRWGLAAVGLVGAVLLVVSEFLPIAHVRAITVVLPGSERTGFDQNSGAMLVLGLLALPMLFGSAWGASRPAMVAVGVLGLSALLIAVVGDHPDITKAGTIFTERYEDARAEAQSAYTFEFVGSILLILSSGLLLLAPAGEEGRGAGWGAAGAGR
jgi:hypothetical protein